jgi:hypothetical protein
MAHTEEPWRRTVRGTREHGSKKDIAGGKGTVEADMAALQSKEEVVYLYGCQPGAEQGETDRGFRGLARTPWASSYAPPYHLYGVFRAPSYPLEPPG